MNHFPIVLKIIEGGIHSNSEKVSSYAQLLASKLENEGDNKSAESLLKLFIQTKSEKLGIDPANILKSPTLPVDKDSRHALADESFPKISESYILLDTQVNKHVEEFLSFVVHSHLLEEAGVGISPSMLIYGPPGCGKTMLANYIAAKLELPLLTARCDSLMSSLLGSTAKNIRTLFDHASSRPCVLFLDEFDALAKARDDHHEVGELKRVVVGLLQNIDKLPQETIVIAATNHEQLLDPAVWRRFAYRLNIKYPSLKLRENMLQHYLSDFAPKSLKKMAEATDGLSGALIKQACYSAIRAAIIEGKSNIDEVALLAKMAEIKYYDIINSNKSDAEKVKLLKEKNKALFTTRILSELLNISLGKISKITNS